MELSDIFYPSVAQLPPLEAVVAQQTYSSVIVVQYVLMFFFLFAFWYWAGGETGFCSRILPEVSNLVCDKFEHCHQFHYAV